MAKILPPQGTYLARRNASIVVECAESGALLAWVPFVLCHADWGAFTGKQMVVLGTKDGTVQKKTLANMKKIWPDFDEANPFSLEELPLQEEGVTDPEFELADCYHDNSYTPAGQTEPIIQFRAQWLNPIGGTQNIPEKMDDASRKQAMAKWGSKFKASAGSSAPAKPAAKKDDKKPAASVPPARAAAGGPPSRKSQTSATARSSSMDEVWNALKEKHADLSDDDLANTILYPATDAVNKGKDVGDFTPQEWGQVADKLEV